jgi:AraC family transcriptional activator of pobA
MAMENSKPHTPLAEQHIALPVHSLLPDDFPFAVNDLAYTNPYDFTKEHRHDYIEILLFKEGGGSQLIDFEEHAVVKNSCYIVFRRQIHLLKRAPTSSGKLIQFKEEFIAADPVRSLLLEAYYDSKPAVIFENDANKMELIWSMLVSLEEALSRNSKHVKAITRYSLQSLLLELLSCKESSSPLSGDLDTKLLIQFRQLLETRHHDTHSVQDYTQLLNTSEKKLSLCTKKHIGLSPLQVIHNRLVLEAKRLLIFEDYTHKESAYRLSFDSPASFSHFIKNKTGSTPSELVKHLANIHK